MAEVQAPDDIGRHLVHLQVERRLASRTMAMYGEAFERLRQFSAQHPVALRDVQVHHVRRWAARLHPQGLAPRSIAIILSAWRGLYRWLGRDGLVALNPVDGVLKLAEYRSQSEWPSPVMNLEGMLTK